jgi:hypothetical protein
MSQHLFARALSTRAAEAGSADLEVFEALVFAPTREALAIKTARKVPVGREFVTIQPPRAIYAQASALLARSNLSREQDRGEEHDLGLGWCAFALEELHQRLGWAAYAPFESSRLVSSDGGQFLLPQAEVSALVAADRTTKADLFASKARAAYRRKKAGRLPLALPGTSEDEAIEIMLDGHRRLMSAAADAAERRFALYIWIL